MRRRARAIGPTATALAVGVFLAVGGAGPGASAASAQSGDAPLTVTARLDLEAPADAVPLGAPFRLIIEARHPPGGIALLPETVDVGADVVERVEARRHERLQEGEDVVDRYTLELLAFEAGDRTIPPITLAFGDAVAETAGLGIYVLSGFSEEEEPVATSTQPEAIAALEQMAAGNPAPRVVFVEDTAILSWLFYALVVLGVAAVAYRWWNRRRARPQPVPPPPPPRPADETALEAIGALRQSPLLSRGDFKTFYTELSVILRRYVGDRYGFESLEMTFEELMAALEPRYTPGLEDPVLRHLLTLSDQVKFAKFVPRKEDGLDALNQAESLVRSTRPTPAPTLTAKGIS